MAESVLAELVKTIAEKVGSEVWKTIVGAADVDSQIKGLQDIRNIRNTVWKIRGTKGELSRISRNHAQFGSIVSSSSLNQTRTLSNVSGSFMSTDMVIGRYGDRENMVSLLLDSSAAAGVLPVASFVGKTTLAQYVYHDERIKRYFDLQLWLLATQDFNVRDVLQQMVTCATNEKVLGYEIDQLQRHLFRTTVKH